MSHIPATQRIYEAFGRGDIPSILALVADDAQWEYGVNATDVPWLQPRRGRAGAGEFFQTLAALEFHDFRAKSFFESGNTVVVLVDLDATVKATGRRVVEEDEVHIWQFDDNGRIARFRHRVDTHQHWAAYKGT